MHVRIKNVEELRTAVNLILQYMGDDGELDVSIVIGEPGMQESEIVKLIEDMKDIENLTTPKIQPTADITYPPQTWIGITEPGFTTTTNYDTVVEALIS